MSGQVDAIGVLYPGGRADLVEGCERRTVEHRADRRQILLLIHHLRRLATRRARPDRPLRILELGGGQGLLTWPLVARLADLPVELHFTDIGATFVEDARRHARARGLEARLRFDRLDLSRPPDPARFPPGGYDAVVAYNVLHAVPDLPAALDHLRPLLAPGGLLGVVEILRTERWDVLTWGLAEGWWSWADAVRTDGPLLSAPAWVALLADRGYRQARALATPLPGEGPLDHALLLAQAPGQAPDPKQERLRALATRPGVRVLPADAEPIRARQEAGEALGPVGSLWVEAPTDPGPPLLCQQAEELAAQVQAAGVELARLAADSPGLAQVLLLSPADPEQGPVDRLLAAQAAGSGWVPLSPPAAEAGPRAVPAVQAPAPPPPAADDLSRRIAADDLSLRIAALAAQVLGLPHLEPDQDFVEHGADSLVMLRLTDLLARELGQPVPAEAAFAGTTARRLAQALAPAAPGGAAPGPTAPGPASAAPGPAPAPATGPLVLLQPQGAGRPFFMVHPATGVVFP
ncbi:methyltransferase [Myxococcota bacterium]|nr:methyltransferase [Myxococcota bacterium]